MRNFRGTIGDQKKNPRSNTKSIERKTIMGNTHHDSSNIRQQKGKTNEDMTKYILETLVKVSHNSHNSSTWISLKPNQKTLMSVISSLIYGIDRQFEESLLDFQSIISLMKFWGFPYNINKTVFLPVGAPHTWHTCLQMMNFMAELTNYHLEYEIEASESEGADEHNDLVFEALKTKDTSKLEEYYLTKRKRLEEELESLRFRNESAQLTIKNIKNSQRSLEQMEREEMDLKQKLDRENQNVIEIDQRNNSLRGELQGVEDEIEELSIEKVRLEKKAQMKMNEIKNQQISADEAKKIELEIAEYQMMISKNKKILEEEIQMEHELNEEAMEFYFNFQRDLLKINESISEYEEDLMKRGINVPKIIPNHNLFAQILNESDMGQFEEKIKEISMEPEIRKMEQGQSSYEMILINEKKKQEITFHENVEEHKSLQKELKQLCDELDKLHRYQEENTREIEDQLMKNEELTEKEYKLESDIGSMEEEKKSLMEQELSLSESLNIKKEKTLQAINRLKATEQKTDMTLQRAMEVSEKKKKELFQILHRISQGFGCLNQDLGIE